MVKSVNLTVDRLCNKQLVKNVNLTVETIKYMAERNKEILVELLACPLSDRRLYTVEKSIEILVELLACPLNDRWQYNVEQCIVTCFKQNYCLYN